jgi:hypothetical protein
LDNKNAKERKMYGVLLIELLFIELAAMWLRYGITGQDITVLWFSVIYLGGVATFLVIAIIIVTIACYRNGKLNYDPDGRIVLNEKHWTIRWLFDLNWARTAKKRPADMCELFNGIVFALINTPPALIGVVIIIVIFFGLVWLYIAVKWFSGYMPQDIIPFKEGFCAYERTISGQWWLAPWKIGLPLIIGVFIASNHTWFSLQTIERLSSLFNVSTRVVTLSAGTLMGVIVIICLTPLLKRWAKALAGISWELCQSVKNRLCIRVVYK